MLINAEEIAALLPHAGAMCLIESVESCSEDQIICLTTTHRSLTNPLRRGGRLGIMAGIEFASQAMALHAALQPQPSWPGSSRPSTPPIGYLASLRAVTFHTNRLDHMDGALTIKATCQHREAAQAIYGFALAAGDDPLIDGRAVVAFATESNADFT
jgi:predicted hotdog family 3-hydroxylacyl-ACP dehydratase